MSSEPFYLGYGECLEVLRRRLDEPRPGRIQLLGGMRRPYPSGRWHYSAIMWASSTTQMRVTHDISGEA